MRLALSSLVLLAATARAASLTGVVADPAGAPLAGVEVAVVRMPAAWTPPPDPSAKLPDEVLARATSGDDGRFEIADGVPKGLHALRVQRPGEPPWLQHGRRVAFGTGATPDVSLVLLPSTTLTARAIDSLGRPAATATVVVTARNETWTCRSEAPADERGVARVKGVTPYAHAWVVGRTAAGAFALQDVVVTGATPDVPLHLQDPKVISGRVLRPGASDAGLAGATIHVVARPEPFFRSTFLNENGLRQVTREIGWIIETTRTDATGAWSARVPTGGRAVLMEPGFSLTSLTGETQRAVIERWTATQIVDASGRPMSGATLSRQGSPWSAVTGTDGRASLPRSDGQPLEARSGLRRAFAPAGTTPSRLTLGEPATILMRVVRIAEDGLPRPVPGARVEVACAGGIVVMGATDLAGLFESALPDEAGWVTAAAGEWVASVEIEGSAEVTLMLAKAPELRLTVRSSGKRASELVLAVAGPGGVANLFSCASSGAGSGTPWSPGAQEIVALRPGTGEVQRVTTAAAGRTEHAFDLTERHGQVVRVVDASGRPVVGARVETDVGAAWGGWLRLVRSPSAVAATDERGIATLTPLPAGTRLELRIAHPAFAPRKVEGEVAPGSVIDASLAPRSLVEGVVLDEGGEPVAGAEVGARADSSTAGAQSAASNWWGGPSAITDGKGAFRIEGIDAGRFELVARAARFVTTEPLPVDVAAGESVTTEIRMKAAAAIVGVVRRADGSGAPASVTAELVPGDVPPPRGADTWMTTPAGEDGRFVLDRTPPGSQWRLQASFEGESATPVVVAAGALDAVLTLEAKGIVEGRAVLPAGTLAPAETRATCAIGGGDQWSSVETDSDGAFTVRGLKEGTYTCTVMAGDLGDGKVEDVAVQLGRVVRVQVPLQPPRWQELLLLDAETRAPVAGGQANSVGGVAKADADGRVRARLRPGETTYRGSAWAEGYAGRQIVLTEPRPAVHEVRLERATMVSGSVVQADGKPAGEVYVRLGESFHGQTKPDGTFEISVSPGRALLVASPRDHAGSTIGSLQVDVPPEGLTGVVIRLRPEADGSALIVVQGEGAGPGCPVVLLHDELPARRDAAPRPHGPSVQHGTRAQGFTDEEATFAAQKLRPGRFTILAGRPDARIVLPIGEITVTSGSQATATVTLKPGPGVVTGRVVSGGVAVPAARVSVQAAEPLAQTLGSHDVASMATSGADGSFRFDSLPEEWQEVVITASPRWGSSVGPSDMSVAKALARPGDDVVLDVAGVTITGVVLADGQPARGAEVVATCEATGNTGYGSARCDSDGRFRLMGREPNARHHVVATLAGKPPATTIVEAGAPGELPPVTLMIGSGELSGTVRSAAGERIRQAIFTCTCNGVLTRVGSVDVAADGAFTTPMASGSELACRVDAAAHAPTFVTCRGGEPVAITLPKASPLRLEITRGGRPVAGARAVLTSLNGRAPDGHLVPPRLPTLTGTGMSDEAGTLIITSLPAGSAELTVYHEQSSTPVSVELKAGEETRASVVLR